MRAVLVEGFGSEALGGADTATSSGMACIEAGPGDSGVTSHILAVCDSFEMGACPFRAQAVPDVNLEGVWSQSSTCRTIDATMDGATTPSFYEPLKRKPVPKGDNPAAQVCRRKGPRLAQRDLQMCQSPHFISRGRKKIRAKTRNSPVKKIPACTPAAFVIKRDPSSHRLLRR